MNDRNYSVYWRTGGTENFRWHRVDSQTDTEAIELRASLRKMGYTAYTERTARLNAIGLPVTFEYSKR